MQPQLYNPGAEDNAVQTFDFNGLTLQAPPALRCWPCVPCFALESRGGRPEMRDLRLATHFRRHEKIDSASLSKRPLAEACGKSVKQMRSDTERYLSNLFGREVKISARPNAR